MRRSFASSSSLRAFGLAAGLMAGVSLISAAQAAPGDLQGAPIRTLLSAQFQDHEVLQRGTQIPVWGTAKPHEKVTVSLAGNTVTTHATSHGNWKAKLPALKAGGPYTLKVVTASGAEAVNKDVMIGDVFLCSGQSNMELPLRLASEYDVYQRYADNKNIRLMHIDKAWHSAPQKHYTSKVTWAVTGPETVKEFSAACYFFGRALQPKIKVPVGLVESAWGGSSVQSWMPAPVLDKVGGYHAALRALKAFAKDKDKGMKLWAVELEKWWARNDAGQQNGWFKPGFDDSTWDSVVPDTYWEQLGIPALKDFDGIVWFRQTITLSAAQAKQDLVLHLGKVDDAAIAYVNGKVVGGTDDFFASATYKVPAGTFHAGTNTIVVSVLDQGAGGGLYSKPTERKLVFADGSELGLNPAWKWHISSDNSKLPIIDHAPWLRQIGLSDLYNAMLRPLRDTPFKAALWYQGEQNAYEAQKYGLLLKNMVAAWREQLGKKLPFFVVQLPGYGPAVTKPTHSDWAALREAQRKLANSDPNMDLSVTIDVGARNNIHPTDKRTVGNRLALLAEKDLYGMDVTAHGPEPKTITRDGDTIAVHYTGLADGFHILEASRPFSFQLCTSTKATSCRYVDAAVQGDTITIDTTQLSGANRVRYCWGDSPICNVYNSANLPAVPFEAELPVK